MSKQRDRGLAAIARRAVEQVGPDIAAHFMTDLPVELKRSQSDPVTDIDRHAEQTIRGFLSNSSPGSSIIGEEFGVSEGSETCVRWHVDPIDGTQNYVTGVPYFATSIGAEIDGEIVAGAVHDPIRGETFWGAGDEAWLDDQPLDAQGPDPGFLGVNTHWPFVGFFPETGEAPLRLLSLLREIGVVRARGSFALHVAHVAAGRAAAAIEVRAVDPWDVAGAMAVVRGAGCSIRILDPPPPGFGAWAGPTFVVARNPAVAECLSREITRLLG